MPSLLLEFPAELGALARIEQTIADFLAATGTAAVDEPVVYNLTLAVQELCVNIVKHAYAGAAGTIRMTVCVADEGQWIDLFSRDCGPHRCNLAAWAAPVFDEPQEHGMGLWLLHALMDDVQYAIDENGDNCWHLHKRLRATVAQPVAL